MELSAATRDAISGLPDVLQVPTQHWFERMAEGPGSLPHDEELIRGLTRLVACSEFAANVLSRYWPELADRLQCFGDLPDQLSLVSAAEALNQRGYSVDEMKAQLRRERNCRLLHILWREVAGVASVEETLNSLSDVADELLRVAANYAEHQMLERFGKLRDTNGFSVPMVTIAMGKLGGRELNFSSDIDLIFTYPVDGSSDGHKCLSGQEYFGRLARNVISLLDEVTEDGFVFRTDTRLRPFGDSGPPVVSFAALESYLLQHGRDWERYAYVKARISGQQPERSVCDELFNNVISPFVYRRYLDYGVFKSLREMYSKISVDVERRELANDIKLGPGGIREIEFIVQSMQLVRGGSQPELQSQSLQTVLPLLSGSDGLNDSGRIALSDAYRFLRRLENFVQALHDKQTHELPETDVDRARLCLAMGYSDWNALNSDLDAHRTAVTRQFKRIAYRDDASKDGNIEQRRFAELFERRASVDSWRQALQDADFVHAGPLAEHIVRLQNSPATIKIETLARDRLLIFLPRLLHFARRRANPVLAVQRSLSVVEQILRRSAYIALLNENQMAIERLLKLCERSAYIAEEIGRFPALLDELLDPEPLHNALRKQDLQKQLHARLVRRRDADSEEHMNLLARFQRANLFRVAVADFAGELEIMKVSDSLTCLAEVVLQHSLAIAWADLTEKYGTPRYELDGVSHAASFGVIAYGKLGGLELSYGSDLDIVFLHDSRGSAQTTNGGYSLDNAVFFSRLVRRLVHFLTTRTRTGVLYEVDTRLRPEGRKGLLVTSVSAFERYQQENAWTWEHQALLRARIVAGDESIAREFERIRTMMLTRPGDRDVLRDDVVAMRARMRAELDRSDSAQFDLKQGKGGVGDIEFLVQFLVLANAAVYPSVIAYSDNIRQLDALADCGAVTQSTVEQLQDIYRAYRLRQHHAALNDEAELVSVGEFLAERSFVCHVWESCLES